MPKSVPFDPTSTPSTDSARIEEPSSPSPIQSDREKYGEWYPQYSLLATTLQLAVPLWIEQLRSQRWDHIQLRAKACADFIAEHGDNILFRAKKKGDSATAFNRLAEGLACLSFAPGGVKIFGEHWESVLMEDVPGRSKTTLTSLLEVILKSLKGTDNVTS